MKLMDKIRSNEARDRDARDAQQRAAREQQAHERGPLSTADLAGMDTQPPGVHTADATRDDLAPARAAREDTRRVNEPDARRVDAPAGMLRDDKVDDAVEVSRRGARADDQANRRADAHASDARMPEQRAQPVASHEQRLAPLFHADVAQGFRARWDATQIGFVDDPRQAVQQADELVAQVMKSLAQSFADERRQLDAQMKDTASTENLRMALQRYRSFFQRLLSL
jgi:hypothetical protein